MSQSKKAFFLASAAQLVLAGAAYATCPAVTQADMMGVAPGAFPQQFDLSEYEAATGCEMEF